MNPTYKQLNFHIKGITPLAMANVALADPRNKYAQEIAFIKSKPAKKKTLEDHARVQDLLWWGSLYLDENGVLGIPARCIEGMFKAAATEQRKGTQFKLAGYCSQPFYPLTYKGPRDLTKLSEDPAFRTTFPQETATGAKTLVTYPTFPDWELKFDVMYHPDMLNPSVIERAKDYAGAFLGFMALRPRYGRFVDASAAKQAA